MQKTKRDITIQFTLLVALVVLCGSVGIYWQQKIHNEQRVQETMLGIQVAVENIQRQETTIMQAVLGTIEHVESIRAAFLRQDRAGLYNLSRPLLDEFKQNHGITHLYVHQPDRVNFLRVHQPERYGDVIERHTAHQAQASGHLASGLELGPMGTLTLRVVNPWYEHGQLIGFIELGTEIGRLAEAVQKQFRADILLFVPKEALKQTEWSRGMQMLGRQADWDAFADSVLIQQTLPLLPPFLHQIGTCQ